MPPENEQPARPPAYQRTPGACGNVTAKHEGRQEVSSWPGQALSAKGRCFSMFPLLWENLDLQEERQERGHAHGVTERGR
eukprot:4591493-Pyramimonas_sp.AAC.1